MGTKRGKGGQVSGSKGQNVDFGDRQWEITNGKREDLGVYEED